MNRRRRGGKSETSARRKEKIQRETAHTNGGKCEEMREQASERKRRVSERTREKSKQASGRKRDENAGRDRTKRAREMVGRETKREKRVVVPSGMLRDEHRKACSRGPWRAQACAHGYSLLPFGTLVSRFLVHSDHTDDEEGDRTKRLASKRLRQSSTSTTIHTARVSNNS